MSPPDAPPKSRRKTTWVIFLALIALGVGVWFFAKPAKDPSYNGKKLSVWLQLLATPEKESAIAAIKGLGPEAIPFLIEQLDNRNDGFKKRYRDFYYSKVVSWPNWLRSCLPQISRGSTNFERVRAANALGYLGAIAAPAVPHLVTALDGDSVVSWAASDALIKIGPATLPFLPAIVRKLDRSDEFAVPPITSVITTLGPGQPNMVPVLVAALREPDRVKIRVVKMLPKFGVPAKAAERDLNPFLNSTNIDLRYATVFALWELAPQRQLELVEHLADPKVLANQQLCLRAAQKLPEAQPLTARAVEVLKPLLEKPSLLNESIRWSVYRELSRRGAAASNAIPVVLIGLRSPEPRVAGRAAETLEQIGVATPEVIAALQAVLQHEHSMVSETAAKALATLQPPIQP